MQNYSDIFIIGGGINGTAIAADAALRGLSVTLCEKNDLGSATSSASSKLIHGGLRYLEFYEFGLVRKALKEREILLKRAPHLIFPLEFVLPHDKHLRSHYLIQCGLFLYDHLSKRTILPKSRAIKLKNNPRGAALLSRLSKGFSYFDCFADDSRLVIANALSAKLKGATILTRTTLISAERENNLWKIEVKNNNTNQITHYYAKFLFNVAGPWVKEINQKIKNTKTQFDIQLDKGSHIIVPKLYEGNFAYILQNKDQRVVFIIPYLNQFSLIGTTDVPFKENLNDVRINSLEENYLCETVNQYFRTKLDKNSILHTYAGVRCLQESSGKEVHKVVTATRDYKFLIDDENNLVLFTVIGGKLTTHRTLAEDAVNQLKKYLPELGKSKTASTPLPGGDIPQHDFQTFLSTIKKDFKGLPDTLVERYAKNYGTNIYKLLQGITSLDQLGKSYGHGLYQVEIDYLKKNEWAETLDDILWRRTKLGLLFLENKTALPVD